MGPMLIIKWNPTTVNEKKILPNSAAQIIDNFFSHQVQGELIPCPPIYFSSSVHVLLTKTWAFSTRNSNLWLETNLDKSELYHARQEPQSLLRGSSHFKASFHLNTNRVNNWQSAKQIPSSFPSLMACSSPPHPPHSHSSFSALLSGDAPTL